MFNDLKQAILVVLNSVDNEWELGQRIMVDKQALYILQSEYNIFFVEPTDKQIDVIEKP